MQNRRLLTLSFALAAALGAVTAAHAQDSAPLTREQVVAELVKARRLGDIPYGDSGKTQAEAFPQRYAAARAQERQEEEAARHVAAPVPTAASTRSGDDAGR